MLLPSILNTAHICAQLGVRTFVLSPGSRSAALTLALVRHPDIDTKIISDERSAAFIALGMAQQLQQPVGLVCTSGSAAYNYAPAVAEAFFQQIPLIILTADRPPEWIDQLDGQTIRQRNIYGQHVKASYELPVGQAEADVWYAGRMVSEAIHLSRAFPAGPVHLNVPIREPFYPADGEQIHFEGTKVIFQAESIPMLTEESIAALQEEWQRYDRKLIVGGQYPYDVPLAEALSTLSTTQHIPVVADVISNMHSVSNSIQNADVLLSQLKEDVGHQLHPDLLITYGLSVISKSLKLFLRKYPPAAHWHIQPAGNAADTFQVLTQVIHTSPATFFRTASAFSLASQTQTDYYQHWHQREQKAVQFAQHLFSDSLATSVGEFQAIQTILHDLPDATDLHLANSMTVRYANLVGLSDHHAQVAVFANRGTSGIDGSNSTAVGSALTSDRLTVLLTGDLAFFYDRNAFWHNYLLPNLRIILLNNHGGGIFRLIDGPSRQPELEEYFETQQVLNAENTARDFEMEYQRIDFTASDTMTTLTEVLPNFCRKNIGHAKLLEIVTDAPTNQAIYQHYKQAVADL